MLVELGAIQGAIREQISQAGEGRGLAQSDELPSNEGSVISGTECGIRSVWYEPPCLTFVLRHKKPLAAAEVSQRAAVITKVHVCVCV